MRWARERAFLAKNPKSVPLPYVLEDEEEEILALGFNLSLEFSAGFGAVIKNVNYAIVKDFCAEYDLDKLAVLGLYKKMVAEMDSG